MNSLWQHRTPLPDFPALDHDLQTDVLVIGGGMAGLLTAYYLQEKGIDTALVEQDRICGGTTGRTTAKLTAQHGLCYHKLLSRCGEEQAQMYYQANAEAVDALKALCRQGNCALENKDNFIFSFDMRKLEAEMSALQKLGIKAKYTNQTPLPIAPAGAVGFADQGQCDPLQLAGFVAGHFAIYERTKVTELIGTTAKTLHGTIRAKKIVVATHFPFLNKHGSYFLKLYQHRSYLMALEGAKPLNAMYVDDSKKGFSFSTFDGCLLLGGGGHRTGKQGGSYPELEAFQKQHYPAAQEICRWAAQDTMSLDAIPYIGHYSANTPDLYVAAGFNKWGMTGSMVSAKLLSAMIAGQSPEYARVFSPSRCMLTPQLFLNGAESTVNLLWPTTRRCPHLGCALKYNKQEHSWDCPCHGSRFSKDGKVLNNPATGDLQQD